MTVFLAQHYVAGGTGTRYAFDGWSNGEMSNRTTLLLNGPESVNAVWSKQYYLTGLAPYGSTSGSGWYNANSIASISLSTLVVPVNSTSRLAFLGWSNGGLTPNATAVVSEPTTVNALFGRQYLVTLAPEDSNGQNITSVGYYGISGQRSNSSAVFVFANRTYNVEYIYYKNVSIETNYQFSADSPQVIAFKTPTYNVAIQTQSVFGTPVNASLNITFKNGTNIGLYSGERGSLSFDDVPYGYVSGYADYLGFKESINLNNGASSYLTFFTASVVIYIVLGIALIVGISVVVAYYEKRREGRRAVRSKPGRRAGGR